MDERPLENPGCPGCDRPMVLATAQLGGHRGTRAWWYCVWCNRKVTA